EEGWVVMLPDPEHVQPDLLGLAGNLDHGVDPFRLTGSLARDRIPGDITDTEDTELHGKPSLYIPRLCLGVKSMRLHIVITGVLYLLFPARSSVIPRSRN